MGVFDLRDLPERFGVTTKPCRHKNSAIPRAGHGAEIGQADKIASYIGPFPIQMPCSTCCVATACTYNNSDKDTTRRGNLTGRASGYLLCPHGKSMRHGSRAITSVIPIASIKMARVRAQNESIKMVHQRDQAGFLPPTPGERAAAGDVRCGNGAAPDP